MQICRQINVKAIPIKCFVSHCPVSCDGGRSVGKKKEKVGLLSKKAWLQSQIFDYKISRQALKNLISTLIKDKDITSYQLLLIKQGRVLVN